MNNIDEYLNENTINKYCEALSKELQEAGFGEHRMLIVGGAAMVLKFRDGRSTIDIDICLREQNHLYECCMKVAEKFDLPEDWINADVMHSDSFSYALFDNAVKYKKYNDLLDVYVASDIDLYCMKLVSFRPKDIQDMQVLSEKLNADGVTRKDIEKNFLRLYGDAYLMKNELNKIRLFEMQFKQ